MPFAASVLTFRNLLTGLGLTLAALSAQAQTASPAAFPAPATTTSRYPTASLGLALGYGAPYGWGVDFSVMVLPKLDVNVGLGASITGGKIGVGSRYYFSPERKLSPFVGANLVYSSGFNHLNITTNNQVSSGGYNYNNYDLIVNFKSTSLLHLRGGVRWQPTYRFALLGAVGYGIVLGGDPVEYVSGDFSQGNRNLVNIFSPGGIELSTGVAFGLGHRN